MTESAYLGLDQPRVWTTASAFGHLRATGQVDSRRTAERRLHRIGLLPAALSAAELQDAAGRAPVHLVVQACIEKARRQRRLVLFAQLQDLSPGHACLHANDPRGGRYWIPLQGAADINRLADALRSLRQSLGRDVSIFPHSRAVSVLAKMDTLSGIRIELSGYRAVDQGASTARLAPPAPAARAPWLRSLEAESLHILRAAVDGQARAALLYTGSKECAVLMHLARKAFFPMPPPFPLLHVDSRWLFQDGYRLRDEMAHAGAMELLVHVNPEAIENDINPFDHGPALHKLITQTEGLAQALQRYGIDLVFDEVRRSASRANARIAVLSCWTLKDKGAQPSQRHAFWHHFNTRRSKDQVARVLPLCHWTECALWQYIQQEGIAVSPLYFARQRAVVARNGALMVVDDDRCRLLPGDQIESRLVRLSSIGCYPLVPAVESAATCVAGIIAELTSHREFQAGEEREHGRDFFDAPFN